MALVEVILAYNSVRDTQDVCGAEVEFVEDNIVK